MNLAEKIAAMLLENEEPDVAEIATSVLDPVHRIISAMRDNKPLELKLPAKSKLSHDIYVVVPPEIVPGSKSSLRSLRLRWQQPEGLYDMNKSFHLITKVDRLPELVEPLQKFLEYGRGHCSDSCARDQILKMMALAWHPRNPIKRRRRT